MRQQLHDQLRFDIVAENVPFVNKTGTVVARPVVMLPDLVGTVHSYLDELQATQQLHWHEGAIPADEVWVKVGGDHGGDSFKMSFQIVNVKKANAIRNIVPFLVFAAKDSPANLTTALHPFVEQVKLLQTTSWQGKTVRVLLYGDYEFQTVQYGLSESSAVHPWLHCTITKADMQLATGTSVGRHSLASLSEKYSSFSAADGHLVDAKKYDNSIRPVILPIEISNAVIPVLHLDLGIFQWGFEAMVKDYQALDVSIAAASSPTVNTDSNEFCAVVAAHQRYRGKEVELRTAQNAATGLKNQLDWLALHGHTLSQAPLQAAAGAIQVQCAQQAQATAMLEADIRKLKEEIDKGGKKMSGPCESSLEINLQRHHICRQRYHSRAFIGNHVHHALQPAVLHDLTSAPSSVIGEPGRNSTQELITAAQVLQERYMALFQQFAACRRRYSPCVRMSPDDVTEFQSNVSTFMATARREVVARRLGSITPKLHLLEAHLPGAVKEFGVGMGLLAEQGGESIHHEGIVNELQRLPARR
eukprot:scpid42675/ scgid20399/ 